MNSDTEFSWLSLEDNVKYLTTLDKFIEPLYMGTPATIIDALPA